MQNPKNKRKNGIMFKKKQKNMENSKNEKNMQNF